ncbi:hypothetical protein ACFL27_16580 [candidate division CSSED10-310 bacterium]|uniref:Glycosyltransferase RgtA/B/C/D-like domain-containing protein n=1 Tax=candidate division CSSED10-310 bacterium TaxID=2855610 RepID=A0ABV6Z035_UNCC1
MIKIKRQDFFKAGEYSLYYFFCPLWGILVSVFIGSWFVYSGLLKVTVSGFITIFIASTGSLALTIRVIDSKLLEIRKTLSSTEHRSILFRLSQPLLLFSLSPLALHLQQLILLQFLTILVPILLLYELWQVLGVTASQKRFRFLVLYPLILCYCFCTLILFQVNIVHDAFQYYGYLRSWIIDHDLSIYNEFFNYNSERFYNPYPHISSRYLGTSLAFLPFFLIGHIVAYGSQFLGAEYTYLMDGYSLPYTLSVSFGSSLYGFLTILLLIRLARRYFSLSSSLLAAYAVWLGTPLLFFMFQWHGWAHTPSAFTVTLFLLLSRRSHDSEHTFLSWLLVGFVLGWMVLIRPSNILFGTVLLWDVAFVLLSGKKGFLVRLKKYIQEGFFVLLGFLVMFCFQLNYWKQLTGKFIAKPYHEVGDYFSWLLPKIFPLLFSAPRHGLLTWSPLILLSLTGVFFFGRRRRCDGWLYLVLFLQQVYLYACWSIWWTGVGFSNRFFINCSPIFVLGMAALFEKLRAGFGRRILLSLVILLILLNINFIAAYRTDTVPMGIASPQRVVDTELSVTDLYRIVCLDMPPRIGSLIDNFWINENFFSHRLINALQAGSPGRVFILIMVFILFILVTYQGVRICFKSMNWQQGQLYLKVIVSGLSLMLLLNVAVIVAGYDYRPIISIHRIPGDYFTITSPNERELFVNYRQPVTHLDIISYLIYGGDIAQDVCVAVIEVTSWDDRIYSQPLRAGREIAECSINRPEYKADLRHSLSEATVVHRFSLTAYSRSLYTGYGYLTTLCFLEPIMVKKVRVKYSYTRGTMVVTDLILSHRDSPS